MQNPANRAIRVMILAAILNLGIQISPTRADTPAALSAINDTADRICGIVVARGETSSTKVTGEVRAELSGLAKNLASIGVEGAGDITSSSYLGMLQSDLPATLKDIRDCKLKVLESLKAIVLPGAAQPQNPNAPAAIINPIQQQCMELSEQVRTRSFTSGMVTSYGEDVARKAVEAMKELGCASMKR